MDLDQIIEMLIAEEGLTEQEALKVAAAQVRAQRNAIQKRSTDGDPIVSVQNDGRGMNYGDETPAEAEARWKEQERNDPQGLYSPGGSSGGGIFGAGTISVDDYDPDAVNRSVDSISKIQQFRLQQQQLEVQKQLLEELQHKRIEQQSAMPRRPQLEDGRGRKNRRLGRKKR